MCGLAGYFCYRGGSRNAEAELRLAVTSMANRGPDGEGIWKSRNGAAGLGHRRLAIIDLSSTGAQPMSIAAAGLHVVFNGEIYNYRELRLDLEKSGVSLMSSSDTEILLHLYRAYGARMLELLRGMYAFAIFDEVRNELFAARDPFGIKPLYYSDDGQKIRFASQVKAILRGGEIDSSPSPAGHVGFYLWGHVPEPHTLFKSIFSLPAGSHMTVTSAGMVIERFFNISEELGGAQPPPAMGVERQFQVKAALQATIARHLVSDVPVAVFLSAGIDSGVVAGLASEQAAGDLRSITLGFGEFRGTEQDETRLAALVSTRYRTKHTTCWVTKDDFFGHLERLRHAMDQPSIDGVNTYFVSNAAAQANIKVALSGLGSDEFFGGYPSFSELPRLASLTNLGPIQSRFGVCIRRVTAPFLARMTSPKYASIFEHGGSLEGAYFLRRGLFMPWELTKFLDADFVKAGWIGLRMFESLKSTYSRLGTDFQRIAALEATWYMRNQLLRDADWAGMAHSVEIRVPFVDLDLLRAMAPYMTSMPITKAEVADSLKTPLPSEIKTRRKTGFFTPVPEWIAETLPAQNNLRGLRGWALAVNPPQVSGKDRNHPMARISA